MMTNDASEGQIFLSHSHINNGFFFLLTIHLFIFNVDKKDNVLICLVAGILYMGRFAFLHNTVVGIQMFLADTFKNELTICLKE